MNRRTFVIAQAAVLAAPWHVFAADSAKVQSLSDALRWLDLLERSPKARSTSTWPLLSVLEHLSQSIEMSLSGFPAPKSALFQNTVGAAAFTVFQWRGKMSHNLTDPIPGAPTLNTEGPWQPGAARLRKAIADFSVHTGALQPHVAYGKLSKNEFALAHTFHIANHQDEITLGA